MMHGRICWLIDPALSSIVTRQANQGTKLADIFLSYKKEDRGRIDTLASALKSEGFDVWFDYEIETGGDWFDQILMQLRQAHCVVGCWSNVSVQDGIFTRGTNSNLSYVQTEHREAGAKLLPILLDADAVPVEFGSLQAEDLTDWVGDTSDARWRRASNAHLR